MSTPITMASTYVAGGDREYGRTGNPTWQAFEEALGLQLFERSRAGTVLTAFGRELLPNARAEAGELLAAAEAYREAKVAEATGEAERFSALVAEYQKAPQVTRKRLYLETMEQVMPKVEKIIIDSGTPPVLPYLPLGRGERRAAQ